jgi:hypothetical protein
MRYDGGIENVTPDKEPHTKGTREAGIGSQDGVAPCSPFLAASYLDEANETLSGKLPVST